MISLVMYPATVSLVAPGIDAAVTEEVAASVFVAVVAGIPINVVFEAALFLSADSDLVFAVVVADTPVAAEELTMSYCLVILSCQYYQIIVVSKALVVV